VGRFAPLALAAFRVPWLRSALMLVGGAVALDGLHHVAAADGGAVLGLGVLAGGWWFLSRRRPGVRAELPSSVEGWFQRCEGVLEQLERLETDEGAAPSCSDRSCWRNCASCPGGPP
jgi:hypothetical protein